MVSIGVSLCHGQQSTNHQISPSSPAHGVPPKTVMETRDTCSRWCCESLQKYFSATSVITVSEKRMPPIIPIDIFNASRSDNLNNQQTIPTVPLLQKSSHPDKSWNSLGSVLFLQFPFFIAVLEIIIHAIITLHLMFRLVCSNTLATNHQQHHVGQRHFVSSSGQRSVSSR